MLRCFNRFNHYSAERSAQHIVTYQCRGHGIVVWRLMRWRSGRFSSLWWNGWSRWCNCETLGFYHFLWEKLRQYQGRVQKKSVSCDGGHDMWRSCSAAVIYIYIYMSKSVKGLQCQQKYTYDHSKKTCQLHNFAGAPLGYAQQKHFQQWPHLRFWSLQDLLVVTRRPAIDPNRCSRTLRLASVVGRKNTRHCLCCSGKTMRNLGLLHFFPFNQF